MHQDVNGCDHDQRAATTAYHTISSYSAAAAMATLPLRWQQRLSVSHEPIAAMAALPAMAAENLTQDETFSSKYLYYFAFEFNPSLYILNQTY